MAALTPRAATTGTATLGVAVAVLAALTLAGPAHAADDPSEPPGTVTTSPPPEVDANSPGLKLAEGATLAPAKVLDIKSVVEDLGGEERREDTNENVTFALQAEVLFPKDSATLNPQARSRIQAIAEEIKSQSATTVRVFGFTDNLGSYAHGLTLSKNRAEAVHDLLAGDLGPNITFEVRGYSEDYPIADNSTEEGRKKNRRVEVSFPRTASGSGSDQS
ncbi:OmpA family protein [Streptomyces ipomoeae]|jgi:outer membrane protein OmpA-like peptidoglycan-associated protein|nr:OmpA family protein [Streptomyces ipomoeae]MDX2699192.1 OmpA family protein [Streptomyces ipomoeae]MDX2827013.1 OmpA family protein [Streptomyces ipomoeae]MDX2842402.1 OmpA family protein [Streptomyces ipomoeae]MDX2878221.1 OmpA family protein [Streptomyces ipomoeae]MDX2934020.1 OmpA family protein [Streptomyces ipomoeae]